MAMPQLHASNGATDMRNGSHIPADESVADKRNGFHHPATNGNALLRAPLELTGLLDQFKSFDVTPVIGTEFPDVQLTDWLHAPNSDALLRDLAITSRFSLPRIKPLMCTTTFTHHQLCPSLSTWGRVFPRSG